MRGFTPHFGGRNFSPRFSGRSFGSHYSRRFSSHRFNAQSAHIRSVRRGRSFNRSVRHAEHAVHTQRNARVVHHNGTGMTHRAARQGRFGSHFAGRTGHPHFANIAARRAWHRGLRAGFVAWYGPVFWPYAYSDIFDYVFWPWGYDDGFWYYAYDDFFDGVFWGEVGPPEDYAYAEPAIVHASYAGVQELCTQPGTGITAWPFAEIERKVGLNADQQQLLADMRKAAADVAASFKASCPAENAFPLTPPGRLQAMTARLQGTLDAVKTVRPALEKFYASLSDEQKERFNELGPKTAAKVASNKTETTGASVAGANSCKEPKPGLATLPFERIKDVVKPTDAQQDGFKQLQDATDKAVSLLQAACPEETPMTPPGRLDAIEKRLQAMIDAGNTVKPSLDSFYASLSSEQKARFNRLDRELARAGG